LYKQLTHNIVRDWRLHFPAADSVDYVGFDGVSAISLDLLNALQALATLNSDKGAQHRLFLLLHGGASLLLLGLLGHHSLRLLVADRHPGHTFPLASTLCSKNRSLSQILRIHKEMALEKRDEDAKQFIYFVFLCRRAEGKRLILLLSQLKKTHKL
jgi:hypothetical protein